MAAEVPTKAVPGTGGPDAPLAPGAPRVPDTERRRDGSRPSLVWDILARVVAERAAATGRARLDVVDVGAGTGGFAVSIARLGHRVTVVDPSPDALAAARWRAAEAGVTLTDVQGEATDLPALAGEPGAAGGGADLVICHNVLEYVDSPSAALAAVAAYSVDPKAARVASEELKRRDPVDFAEPLIGNPTIPALHGGVLGAFMELTAVAELARRGDGDGPLPRTIGVTVEYLRSGRARDTYARAEVRRLGRRIANVAVEAWQDDRARPVALLHGRFLLPTPGEAEAPA